MQRLFTLLIFGGILFSCQQDDHVLPSSKTPVSHVDAGELLAKHLSHLVADRQIRGFLKEKVLERFDGDNNFLIAMHTGDMLPDGRKFADVLNGVLIGETLDIILQNGPQLQLAMPDLEKSKAAEWDVDSHIPIVVYRSPELDPETQHSVTGYRLGKRVEVSLDEEPDEQLLVVSNNERTLLVPAGKSPEAFFKAAGMANTCSSRPVYESDEYKYYLKASLESCDVYVSGPGDASSNCERDLYNYKDHVARARFTTMNYMREAENYLDGNPEVYFIVTLASKNPSGFSSLRKSYPSRDRSEWKDCGVFSCVPEWHSFSQPVFNWNKDVFGDLVRYDWFEEDFSTGKVDLTLGLTSKFESTSVSGNVKITINKKDYFLDQDFVNYCDRANGRGTEYNTGKLLFNINHR